MASHFWGSRRVVLLISAALLLSLSRPATAQLQFSSADGKQSFKIGILGQLQLEEIDNTDNKTMSALFFEPSGFPLPRLGASVSKKTVSCLENVKLPSRRMRRRKMLSALVLLSVLSISSSWSWTRMPILKLCLPSAEENWSCAVAGRDRVRSG